MVTLLTKFYKDDFESTPFFRGSSTKEVRSGVWLSESERYAKKYATGKFSKDGKSGGGGKRSSGTANVKKYFIPKKGMVDFSKDKELQKDYFEKVFMKDFVEKGKLKRILEQFDFWSNKTTSKERKKVWGKDFKNKKEFQEAIIKTQFKELFLNGHPSYIEEDVVIKYLDKNKKGWSSVKFYEGDASKNDLKGNVSVRTSGRGVAKSALVLEDSKPLIELTVATISNFDDLVYQGATFKQHISKAFPNQSKKVLTSLRGSVKSGESIADATRVLKKVLGRSGRDVKTITRSYIMANSAEAKKSVYSLAPEIIGSLIWTATLDARTTPNICGVRDGLKYDEQTLEPIGHGNPWNGGPSVIHWNCRSTSYPEILGVTSKMNRPEVGSGPNYKAGDNKNSRGKVRKNTKKLREDGIIKTGQVSNAKYSTWLKKQNAAFQDDVLGKAKGLAFRKGEFQLGGKL